MNLEPFQILTGAEVRALVYQFLRRRPDVELAIPVDIERLIELMPNTCILPKDNLADEGFAHAAVCRDRNSNETQIWVDLDLMSNSPWADYLCALGEELAHLVLHQNIICQIQTFEDFRLLQKSDLWLHMETAARLGSLHLRMPDQLLVPAISSAYERCVFEYGFGDLDKTENEIHLLLADQFKMRAVEVRQRIRNGPFGMQDELRTRLLNRCLNWKVQHVKERLGNLRQLELFAGQ